MTQPYPRWKSFTLPEFYTHLLESEGINLKRLLSHCKGQEGSRRELSGSDLAPSEVQRRLYL